MKKIVVASTLGNALEFYDFTLYGVFVTKLTPLYFPNENTTLALIAFYSTFAIGFLARPFGGSLFGYIGDKYGRKNALSLSILLMGIPTLMIGLLPGYDVLGISAPIILVLCRILQGLCTGGEYNGAAIYALEHTGKKPGLVGGFIGFGTVLGALTAMFVGTLILSSNLPEWGWRLAFILGAFISVLGYIIRRNLDETPEFIAAIKNKKQELKLRKVLASDYKSIILSISLGILNGSLSYTLFSFMNVYLSRYVGFKIESSMKANLVGLATFMIFCPIFGYIYDKVGREKTIGLVPYVILIAIYPIFMLFNMGNMTAVVLAQFIMGACIALIVGPGFAYLQSLFPVQGRYTGISTSFAFGMGFGGGTTPIFLTYLIDHYQNVYMPVFLIGFYAIMFLVFRQMYESEIINAPATLGAKMKNR